MERKRHIKLVNGLSRVQDGNMKVRGRKDIIPHITLSCDVAFPPPPEGGSGRDARMMVGFSMFRRRGSVESLVETNGIN